MTDEPTLGEVVRRLEDVAKRLDSLSQQMAEREERMGATFLPRREFDLSQQTDSLQMVGIEREVHSISKRLDATEERRRADRALVFTALVAPILVALITAALLSGSAL